MLQSIVAAEATTILIINNVAAYSHFYVRHIAIILIFELRYFVRIPFDITYSNIRNGLSILIWNKADVGSYIFNQKFLINLVLILTE